MDRALAAILLTYISGNIHPIVFHSRIFNNIKINYDIYNKKLLAIYETFKKWQYYLEDTSALVEVFTDHKNLTYFCDLKSLSQCQA